METTPIAKAELGQRKKKFTGNFNKKFQWKSSVELEGI